MKRKEYVYWNIRNKITRGDIMEKLLIVEDDNDLREWLAFTFRSEKYEAIRADTVKKAKECLRQTDVQGIILDCNLPDGNGFELCKQLREKSDIPIMILTARDGIRWN